MGTFVGDTSVDSDTASLEQAAARIRDRIVWAADNCTPEERDAATLSALAPFRLQLDIRITQGRLDGELIFMDVELCNVSASRLRLDVARGD